MVYIFLFEIERKCLFVLFNNALDMFYLLLYGLKLR